MLFRRGTSNKERFERLAEESFPSVFGTALRLTHDREEAQDLAQEAIIRAYEAFDRFDGRNFKAWILRILTNLYINKYRRRQRSGTTSSLDEELAAEPMAQLDQMPDRLVFDEMMGSEVEAALGRVPPDFRTAVLLSDVEGLSYEEIADATEVPIGTVRSRIARGRAILRRELERFAREEGYIKTESTQSIEMDDL